VTGRVEAMFGEAFVLGRDNQKTIELARRHCLDMKFTKWAGGGQGMAEQMSGLPIDTRQVSCPVARGNTAGMNLAVLARDFYEEHCDGCIQRRPTGELPNLASVIDAAKAEGAARATAEDTAAVQRRGEWENRAEHRRALITTADPAMAGALEDLAILDRDPAADADRGAEAQAVQRLQALADQAPETFRSDAVAHAIELVDARITAALGPLRHLARHRHDVAPLVAQAALRTLAQGSDTEAGRCLADLAALLEPEDLITDVIRSLVSLAGPSLGALVIHHDSRPGDPSGLRAAATVAPGAVTAVLQDMLPKAHPPSPLLVPPGTGSPHAAIPGDLEQVQAAAAAAALASTHPDVAGQLIASLVGSLRASIDDLGELHPAGAVQHALAVMLVLGTGDVTASLESAAASAGDDDGERLFGVLAAAARFLDPDQRWREPGDPLPEDDRRQAVFDTLLTASLARLDGDWGASARHSAASLLSDLADSEPAWVRARLDAILGAFLSLAGQPPPAPVSPLIAAGGPPPALRALEEAARQASTDATVRQLMSTLERLSTADPAAVCQAVVTLITNERDSDLGPGAIRHLLPLLGKIGARHGAEQRVLPIILPVLHSYLVDGEAALRAGALRAWTDIAAAQPVPSSLADLLPALVTDTNVGVIGRLLSAARRLSWPGEEQQRLFGYACVVCVAADAGEHTELLKSAIDTVDVLAPADGETRDAAERLMLRRAAELDGYDLRDALSRTWSPAVACSASMAQLRLRLVRDPSVNDRFQSRGDEQLCALLECGPGLTSIPASDLIGAAAELNPAYPLQAADFAEVAWRAGRPADAAAVMRAVQAAMPDQPAYSQQRALAQLLIDAADTDMASTGPRLAEAAQIVARSAAALESSPSDLRGNLLRQVKARMNVKLLLTGQDIPPGISSDAVPAPRAATDPAKIARNRAERLRAAARELDAVSQRATSTAAYLRVFAGLCEAGAHLLLLQAAELDADTSQAAAHLAAARGRTELLAGELGDRFTADDPLAAPLAAALAAITGETGAPNAAVLASWAALPLPILIADGPRRIPRPTAGHADPDPGSDEMPDPSVAVVLASLDGKLITGPQVLRPSTVYELGLEVRPGPWPDWADHLDAELISHLTPEEAQTPVLSWPRPVLNQENHAFTSSGTLILRFGLPAGRPAPPFLVTLRWRGQRDGRPITETIDVAGHRQIRLRPFDATRDHLTNYPVLDERLLALYDRLTGAGYDQDHLQAFSRLFTAICRAAFPMMWEPKYKHGTRILEREFHDDLHARLISDMELGGRVERGTPLALGFLDVHHDKITAELKVERRTPVTKETAPKYIGQPTQYASADGARLSILCVLDMTSKVCPVGTPENYVFELTPELHGLTNPEAPSLVVAIVINVCNPPPSSRSRRKTPVRTASPPPPVRRGQASDDHHDGIAHLP